MQITDEKKHTVLIVEHDRLVRDLMSLALERVGLRPICVDSSTEALEASRNHKPELVLLDIPIPHTNGLDLIRQFCESSESKRTPVIVISSLGFGEIVKEAIAAGAKDFIIKPFDVNTFIQRVLKILRLPLQTSSSKQNFQHSNR